MNKIKTPKEADVIQHAGTLAEAGLESYDVIEIDRAELKNATYNPRKLSETQRKKLKAGLKRHGLAAPLTWNKRTGNIVGGHQRISIMDTLMRTTKYKLRVAAINVSEGREKELNILLNNSLAQGEWDIGALTEMFKDESIQVEGTGFDIGDVYQLMGETPFEARSNDAGKMAEKLDAVKGLYDTIRDRNQKREESEFYTVLVFKTEERLATFIERAGLANSRYQSGEKVAEAMGIDLEGEAADAD